MALTLFRANECSLYRPSRCSRPGLGSSMQLSCCERCLDGLSEGVYPRSQNRTSGSACLFVCVCFACSLAEDQGPKVLLACLFVCFMAEDEVQQCRPLICLFRFLVTLTIMLARMAHDIHYDDSYCSVMVPNSHYHFHSLRFPLCFDSACCLNLLYFIEP